MLEDRRRFRRWQKYIVGHLCQPVRDRFDEQAATAGIDGFASMTEILEDRRKATAVEWQTPAWEWVDPQSEQSASDAALTSFQSTYQDELGQRGKNWRNVFYQRAKEEKLKRQLGLVTADMANVEASQAEAQQMAATAATAGGDTTANQPTGEMANTSRLQWGRNRKAIEDILQEFIQGTASETKARVMLQTLGLTEATATMLIQDAQDGTVDTDLSEEPETETVERAEKGGRWVSNDDGVAIWITDGGEVKTGPSGKTLAKPDRETGTDKKPKGDAVQATMDARAKKAQKDIKDLKQKLDALEAKGPNKSSPEIDKLQAALADIDAKKADTQKKLEEVQARIKANKEKLAAMKAKKS